MLEDNLIFRAFPEKARKMVERMLLTSIKGSVVTKVVAISRVFFGGGELCNCVFCSLQQYQKHPAM
jgi:hypothetical protein